MITNELSRTSEGKSQICFILAFVFLILPQLIACSPQAPLLFKDLNISKSQWLPHQAPESVEEMAVCGEQAPCLDVRDSNPSFGGIILKNQFSLKARAEYEVSYKLRVLEGMITMQIIENQGPPPIYITHGNLAPREWQYKHFRYIASKDSSTCQFNFTNADGSKGVHFQIANFYVREVPLRERLFRSGEIQ